VAVRGPILQGARVRFPFIISAVALFLLAAAQPVSAQKDKSGRTHIREGNGLYDKKQYPDAEVSYRKALEGADDPVVAKFNLGDALYQQERYDEAAGQYEGAASATKDASVRSQAYHNLGNALLKGKKLEESIESYKRALKLAPKDEDTRYNLEYAKRLLQQQQQQKQDKKDQKQDKKKDQQDKKDDQKKDDQQQKQDQQQDKQDQKKDPKQQPRQPKDQISKADAERILEALKKQEQDVKKKLQKQAPVRVKVGKDW
jgi:Ca-activated chloride channel family protein